jgi:phage shock protein A
MGAFKRVSDIISANLNDVIESFEAPEPMLRHAIREMDAAVGRTLEAAARVIADERLLESEIAHRREESAELYRRAREALLRSDENGAREALSCRHENETLIAGLDGQRLKSQAAAAKIRRQLDAMRLRRAEAERKLHLLVARDCAAAARRHSISQPTALWSGEAGFVRFERLCRKIERTEAETDALIELASPREGRTLPDDQIDAQLQILKQECRS